MNRQELLNEIEEYRNLPPGWDGESDKPTNSKCLDYVKEFILSLSDNDPLPLLSCATGEEVSLYWRDPYRIIHFLSDGTTREFKKD